MLKILPFFLFILVLAAAFSYIPIRREIVYRLGISQDPTTSCCDGAEVAKSNGQFDESASVAIFNNQPIDYPKTSLAEALNLNSNRQAQVLGTTNQEGKEKWIEVSLEQQVLRAWEGSKIVMEFPISSGKWFPTPKGIFHIWYKTKSQRMVGGSKFLGTYYDLPNVPYNMFFYQGFALHGAYWHNNFGHPMSHGCVNEPIAQSAELFAWAGPNLPEGIGAVRATDQNPGTKVFVH